MNKLQEIIWKIDIFFELIKSRGYDEKILELRAELGWEGYGIFWAIIECLREASGYKYSKNRLNGLALQLSTTKEKLEQIILNYGLFNLDEEFFWSESLLRRMEERDSKVRKAKESVQKRWEDYYAKQEQRGLGIWN